MLPLLVPARRGKFSPGAVSAAPGDKEARRVVPVPCTQQQEAAEARLYDEGGCGDPGPREREGGREMEPFLKCQTFQSRDFRVP